MIVSVKFASVKSTKTHEYVLRFLFGGIVTTLAGLIAKRYGPVFGGLFLAFPAIFPASVTLIANHEKQRKQKAGYDGTSRGRTAAGIEAAGTVLGALALILFAFVLYRFLPAHNPILTLTVASLIWLLLSCLLWLLAKRRHLTHQ
jgi:succinate-acetate transporter protein